MGLEILACYVLRQQLVCETCDSLPSLTPFLISCRGGLEAGCDARRQIAHVSMGM